MTHEKEWANADEAFQSLQRIDPDGLATGELDDLVHHLTAVQLVRALQQENASPGMLQAALRFLKDNDITSLPIPGSAQAEMEKKLGGALPFTQTGSD